MLQGKNKKSIWINVRWIRWKTITKFVGIKANTHRYLKDGGSEDKKRKGTKKCAVKRKPEFEKKCELPDASYSVSNIQDLSAYIL